MKYCIYGIALILTLCAAPSRAGEWFRAIEITSEKTVEGKMDYTVRFTPARNHHCDKIVFECVYHQEFPWENVRGKKYTKVHEPTNFSYERGDVKMVNDLDQYVSFRAPYGLKALMRVYGPKLFNKDYPVTVDRIRMTGKSSGNNLWSYEIKVNTRLDAKGLAAQHEDEEEAPGTE